MLPGSHQYKYLGVQRNVAALPQTAFRCVLTAFFATMRSFALPLLFFSANAAAKNIVVSNDDGWATAQIRQMVDVLTGAKHDVSFTRMG